MVRGVFSKDNGEVVFWSLLPPESNSGVNSFRLYINKDSLIGLFPDEKIVSESQIVDYLKILYNRGFNVEDINGSYLRVQIDKFVELANFLDSRNVSASDCPKYLKNHSSINIKYLDFLFTKFPHDSYETLNNYLFRDFPEHQFSILNLIAFCAHEDDSREYDHRENYIAGISSEKISEIVRGFNRNFFPDKEDDYCIFDGLDSFKIEKVFRASGKLYGESEFFRKGFIHALKKIGKLYEGKDGERVSSNRSNNDLTSVNSMSWDAKEIYSKWFSRETSPEIFSNLSYKLVRTCLFKNDHLRYHIVSDHEVLGFWGLVQILGMEKFKTLFSLLWNGEAKIDNKQFYSICEKVNEIQDLLEIPQSVFNELVLGETNE